VISKIFVVHYTKLLERKKHMMSEVQKWNLDRVDVEFEESHDQEIMDEFDIRDALNIEKFKQNTSRSPSPGEISLCLKYKDVLRKISKMQDDEYILVLEDDVIFKEDPFEYVTRILQKCDEENISFDCLFMGEAAMRIGDNRDIFIKKDPTAWPLDPSSAPLSVLKNGTLTNGMCTVLYRASAVKRLCMHMDAFKVDWPIDWYFNIAFRLLDLDVYWGKAITEHGSVSAVHNKELEGLKSALREGY